MKDLRNWGRYSPEFRRKATILTEELGSTSASEKLGIGVTTLTRWLTQERLGMRSKPDATQAEKERLEIVKENLRLKKENEELKKTNLVLKELASFFSKDRPDTDSRRSEKLPKKSK